MEQIKTHWTDCHSDSDLGYFFASVFCSGGEIIVSGVDYEDGKAEITVNVKDRRKFLQALAETESGCFCKEADQEIKVISAEVLWGFVEA